MLFNSFSEYPRCATRVNRFALSGRKKNFFKFMPVEQKAVMLSAAKHLLDLSTAKRDPSALH